MQSQLQRRTFIVALGAAVALALSCLATTAGFAQERASGTLRVGSYGGTFTAAQKKYIGDLFTERTGMKVQYVDASATDLLSKLIAAKGRKPPFDVVYLETDVRDSAIDLGVFAKIDPKLVPNLKFVYELGI
jgi:putative spermidine/putrescine transport system substrate-binding protein